MHTSHEMILSIIYLILGFTIGIISVRNNDIFPIDIQRNQIVQTDSGTYLTIQNEREEILPVIYNLSSSFFPIGGLIDISAPDDTPTFTGVHQVVAFQCAVDYLNEQNSLLTNVTIVYDIIDTQDSPREALAANIDMITFNNTIAIVGPTTSSQALVTSSFSSSRSVCLVSHYATAIALDDPAYIPFLRTIPDDQQLMNAMFAFLLAMNWTFVLPIFTNDPYGSSGRTLFIEMAVKYNITYECIYSVGDREPDTEVDFDANSLQRDVIPFAECASNSDATVIIIYATTISAIDIVDTLSNYTDLDEDVYIFTNIFPIPNDPFGTFPSNFPLRYMEGNIILLPNSGNLSIISNCFYDYLEKNIPTFTQRGWMNLFRCINLNFSQNVLEKFGSLEYLNQLPLCTTNDYKSRPEYPSCRCTGSESLTVFTPTPGVGYVTDAVFAIGLALNRIITNCSSITSFNACELEYIDGKQLYLVMVEFPFTGVTGEVTFSGTTRLNGSFEFLQIGANLSSHIIGSYTQEGNLSTISPIYIDTVGLAFRPDQYTKSSLNDGSALDTAFGPINIALCSLLIIASISLVIFFYLHRNDQKIKRSSPLFNQLILLGLIMLCIGSILWSVDQTQAICIVKIWISVIGFSLVICSILVKTYRVNRIFHTLRVRQVGLTNLELIKYSIPFLLVEIILLLVYTFANGLPYPFLEIGRSPNVFSYTICTTSNSTFQGVMIGLILGFNYILVIVAAILAYQVRDVVKEYNESVFITYLVYLYTVLGILVMAIYFTPGSSPQTADQQYISRSCGILIGVTATIVLLFVPRLPFHRRKVEMVETSRPITWSISKYSSDYSLRNRTNPMHSYTMTPNEHEHVIYGTHSILIDSYENHAHENSMNNERSSSHDSISLLDTLRSDI